MVYSIAVRGSYTPLWISYRTGCDHDDVAVGRRRHELVDHEGALQLDRRVVRVLPCARTEFAEDK